MFSLLVIFDVKLMIRCNDHLNAFKVSILMSYARISLSKNKTNLPNQFQSFFQWIALIKNRSSNVVSVSISRYIQWLLMCLLNLISFDATDESPKDAITFYVVRHIISCFSSAECVVWVHFWLCSMMLVFGSMSFCYGFCFR